MSTKRRSARTAVDWLEQRVADEPWSARALAAVGVLLALVSGIDQFGKQPDWYESMSKWVAVILTVLLVLISGWFASDARRIKQWSQLSADLQARLVDLESLHPDSLSAAVNSVHDEEESATRIVELQRAVDTVSKVFADGGRAPTRDEVVKLETAAGAALSPSVPDRDASWRAEAPDVAGSWQSVAGLHATARRASVELGSKAAQKGLFNGPSRDPGRDPRNRWPELIAIATVVVGLLAAPTVADTLTSESGPSLEETAFTNLSNMQGELLTAVQSLNRAAGPVTTRLSDALRESRPAEPVDLSALASIETQLKAIVKALEPEDPVEIFVPVGPSDTLWEFARKMCDNDGSARQIVMDVISLWDANTAIVGADPNALEQDSLLVMNCADG